MIVYDTETNKYSMIWVFLKEEVNHVFQISKFKDDRYSLFDFLKENQEEYYVGFNNLEFDYPILHNFIRYMNVNQSVSGRKLVADLYLESQKLIHSKVTKFNVIRNPYLKQIDLRRIHHLDNIAKATSLKEIMFNYRVENIIENPYHWELEMNEDQINETILYCINDVIATKKFLDKSLQEIDLRAGLSVKYNIDMSNFDGAKIGEQIILHDLRKKYGVDTNRKTPRTNIKLKDLIFPFINFKGQRFNLIYDWLSKQVINQIKGAFTELPLDKVKDLLPYCNNKTVKGKLKTLNIYHINDKIVPKPQLLEIDFGLGGLHASADTGIYEKTDKIKILDIDVSGFYPSLSQEWKFFPEHLTEKYCTILEELGLEREKYPKGSIENTGIKLSRNASYGKSNSQFSNLYDPFYTLKTTVNGQLLLCMLIEQLEDLTFTVQANTDGITVMYNIEDEKAVLNICKEWEIFSRMKLEYNYYSKMIILNVNNYLAFYENGSIKKKGSYFLTSPEIHQNFSKLIIPKALNAYFVDGIPVKKFIYLHEDLYDFFLRAKINRTDKLLAFSSDDTFYEEQHLCRYYVANEGYKFIKEMPPLPKKPDHIRHFEVEKEYLCMPANDLKDFDWGRMKNNINYDYYIRECEDIINKIENNVTQMQKADKRSRKKPTEIVTKREKKAKT